MQLVDDDFIGLLEEDEGEQERWLLFESHPDFPGQWKVNSLGKGYLFDLKEHLGPYRTVSPASLKPFLEAARSNGYDVAFFDNPSEILSAYEHLNDQPDVSLNTDLEGTINGLLPFQVQGYNYLRDLEAGVAMWSTGTGKTVLASILLKHHLENQTFDIAWFVVKGNNKVNTQRVLKRLAGLDSVIISGDKKARKRAYISLGDCDEPRVCVTNYEKFRVDHVEMLPLFENKKVLMVWDEMPTKLKTRTAQLYESVVTCLYTSKYPRYEKRRPASLRQYMLSATPIENDPEDWFNCVRILDPRIYGSVTSFRDEYVVRYNFFDEHKPEVWHKLDKIGLKAAHITHQVDKQDPDIAAQFPAVIEEPFYVDWDEKHRAVYDLATKEAVKIGFDDVNPLALITVLQMLCDAPTMITDSASVYAAYQGAVEAWIEDGGQPGAEPLKTGSEAAYRLVEAIGLDRLTDVGHTKLETLRGLLCEVHPDEKVAIFAALSTGLLPILEQSLRDWGISYVRYAGTERQRQAAEDAFRDGDERVFLSSDLGSDSINLEKGSVCIHYDLPWKWSTYIQRQNRIHRVTSTHEKVRFYTLMMADSIEDRKMQTIMRKMGYHEGVFKGAIANNSTSARMTRADLLYIISGVR